MMSTIRRAAWPSQVSGRRPAGHRPSRISRDGRLDLRRVVAHEPVRPAGDGDRPLGVLAERQAGDAQRGRLLLDAPRVGQDQPGAGHQAEEREVGSGSVRRIPGGGAIPAAAIRARGPGVDREEDRQPARDPAQDLEQAAQRRRRRPRSRAGAGSAGRTRRARRPGPPTGRSATAASTCFSSVSTMQLPTRWIRSRGHPLAPAGSRRRSARWRRAGRRRGRSRPG